MNTLNCVKRIIKANCIFIALAVLVLGITSYCVHLEPAVAQNGIDIPDPNLERVIRAEDAVTGKKSITATPITRADLEAITHLRGQGEHISDLSGLEYCINLTELDLRGNEISDISALVPNEGLGEGDTIYLQGNPLSWDSISVYIPELRGKGVTVVYDQQAVTGNITVVPNCEGMTAEYTITFDIHASLSSGVHNITIWFPEGTTVP